MKKCELRILNSSYFRKQDILKIRFKLLANMIIIITFVSISTIMKGIDKTINKYYM